PSAGKIYFNRRIPLQSNQIYSANLDGSGEELLIDLDPGAQSAVVSMSVDAASGRLYWTSRGDRLFRANLDGTLVATVAQLDVSGNLTGLAIMPARPGVTVTPRSGLVTSEAGDTASFSVVLDAKPTANVTIPVASS